MAIGDFEIKPFITINHGLSIMQEFQLLNKTFKSTSEDENNESEEKILIRWLLITKFIKTLYNKHNGITQYKVKVKTEDEHIKNYIQFRFELSGNSVTVYSNIKWNYGDGIEYRLEDVDISESLRGLTNWANNVFWQIKMDRSAWIIGGGYEWFRIYNLLQKTAEKSTL
jgi:hypothetical protein